MSSFLKMVNEGNYNKEKSIMFVYGSLKEGFHNHKYLDYCKLLGYGYIEGYQLYNLKVGFPAIVEGEYEDRVFGQVYEVDCISEMLIDGLEGWTGDCYDSTYIKRREVIHMGSGKSLEGSIYIWNYGLKEYHTRIMRGVWTIEESKLRRDV